MLWQLLKKELRLQRSSLAFALAVVLVWGALLALTRQAATVLIPNMLTMGQLVSLMQTFFVGPCLLAIAPLLVGAAMVAEERKLGVWEWQLSLPAPRLLQWTLKLAVGAAITLLLAFVIQPALDVGMDAALGDRGNPFPLPLYYLRLNQGYVALPLLLMAAGAFVSSISADPYKAFFGGLVVFGAAVGCTRLADPAGMLLAPWPDYFSNPVIFLRSPHLAKPPYLMTDAMSLILVIALSAILAGSAWFNFRYEGFRWRRFLLELSAMVVLIGAAAALALRCEFSPVGLIGQRIEDVEPLIVSERQRLGYAPPTVDWTGIQPLIVRRATPGPCVSRTRMADFRQRPLFSEVARFPAQDRILAAVNSFPARFEGNSFHGWNQIVEIDMPSRSLRPIHEVMGDVGQVFPSQSGCFIRNNLGEGYLITQWPVPIRVGGLLWRLCALRGTFTDPSPFPPGFDASIFSIYSRKEIEIDNQQVRFEALSHIDPANGYWQIYLKREPVYENWLIRRQPSGTWTLVDKQKGEMYYAVSSDGKWFVRQSRIHGAARNSLGVFAADHSTSWTVSRQDGNLSLSKGGQVLRLSPSGRFLPFLRTWTISLDENGKSLKTGYPSKIDVGALDLRTGREIVLLQAGMERSAQERFRVFMQDWLWRRWLGKSGLGLREGMGQPSFYFHQDFPPMAWAPGRDKLAILYDETLHLFEYLPEQAERVRSWENLGGFVPPFLIDLTGFQLDNIGFWNDNTILAWGNLGLFEIQLSLACQRGRIPPSSSQPAA